MTYLHTQNSQATILIKFNLSISLLLVKCTRRSFRFFFLLLYKIPFEIREGSYEVQFREPYELWWTQMMFRCYYVNLIHEMNLKKKWDELKSYPQRRRHSHHSSIRKADMWSNKRKMYKWKNDCWTFVIMWIFPNDVHYSFTHSCLFSP